MLRRKSGKWKISAEETSPSSADQIEPIQPPEPAADGKAAEPVAAPESSPESPPADPAPLEAPVTEEIKETVPAISAEKASAPEPSPPSTAEPIPDPAAPTEPMTLAEQLTARERKRLAKAQRAASKRQRQADKEKRKADRKAAKKARKAPATETPQLPESAPSAPFSTHLHQTDYGPVELPPITPPGGHPQSQKSRRPTPLVGAIDLGGTKIAAAVLDADHNVIAYRRRPTPDKGGPADVIRAMALAMQEAAVDAGTEAHRLLAVGVGAPGSVNPETGSLTGAGNLPDWDGTFQLGMALREELGTEVRVGNDVQVGTRAEYELGAGADYSSLLGVFWGTGVGGGIILDGDLWLGRGRAGEIGHTLIRRGGAKGLNGLNGTVEAYAGRAAMEAKARREYKKGRKTKLFKLMKKHDKTHLTSAIWERALDHGDELAEDLLNRAVAALAAGIASSVNLLDPEAVVIGGGMGVRFADTLVPEIIAGMTPYLLDKDNPPDVRVAKLGDEGGVIGASLLLTDIIEAHKNSTA